MQLMYLTVIIHLAAAAAAPPLQPSVIMWRPFSIYNRAGDRNIELMVVKAHTNSNSVAARVSRVTSICGIFLHGDAPHRRRFRRVQTDLAMGATVGTICIRRFPSTTNGRYPVKSHLTSGTVLVPGKNVDINTYTGETSRNWHNGTLKQQAADKRTPYPVNNRTTSKSHRKSLSILDTARPVHLLIGVLKVDAPFDDDSFVGERSSAEP